MLSKIKNAKQLKMIYILMMCVAICVFFIFCVPLFQILIEIISNAGRIVGTFIRLNV